MISGTDKCKRVTVRTSVSTGSVGIDGGRTKDSIEVCPTSTPIHGTILTRVFATRNYPRYKPKSRGFCGILTNVPTRCHSQITTITRRLS